MSTGPLMMSRWARLAAFLPVLMLLLQPLLACDTPGVPPVSQEPLTIRATVQTPQPVPVTPAKTPAPLTVAQTPSPTPNTTPSTPPPIPPPASASPSTPEPPLRNEALVTRVIDGDTIEVSLGGRTYSVRYIGINTPETKSGTPEPFGPEATVKNRTLVEGKTVKLEKDVSETDQFGRLLRYVYVGDVFVNAELVKSGYARAKAYPPDTKFDSLFLSLQNEAQAAKRGMWAPKYVGSKAQDKYHYPTCTSAKRISLQNEVWFVSVPEARTKGYKPCGICKPPAAD